VPDNELAVRYTKSTEVVAPSRDRFEQFVRDEVHSLTRHVRVLYPYADIDDVVNRTFSVAWRKFDQLQPDARAWLRGTARRVVANDQRGQRRWRALTERASQMIPDHPAPAPDEPASLELRIVSDAIDRLSESDRDVLLMCALEELDTDDLARILNIAPSAAKKRLSRARERLRNALAQPTDGGEGDA